MSQLLTSGTLTVPRESLLSEDKGISGVFHEGNLTGFKFRDNEASYDYLLLGAVARPKTPQKYLRHLFLMNMVAGLNPWQAAKATVKTLVYAAWRRV